MAPLNNGLLACVRDWRSLSVAFVDRAVRFPSVVTIPRMSGPGAQVASGVPLKLEHWVSEDK